MTEAEDLAEAALAYARATLAAMGAGPPLPDDAAVDVLRAAALRVALAERELEAARLELAKVSRDAVDKIPT